MGHSLNRHIKGCLMIIVKLSLLLILSCKKMDKQYFQVFGKEELLKNTKINLLKIDDQGHKSTSTILCNGKLNKIDAENEAAFIYEFYISYNDSHVQILKMENIFRNASDEVNQLYLEKKDNNIFVKFIGREADLKVNEGFQKKLILKDEYYKLNHIQEDEELKKNNQLFFECK